MADPSPTPTLPLTPAGLPDWPAIEFDIHCSRCGYNLRMLTTPRCTECGFQFEWVELIRGLFDRNPNLFEHAWRQQPVRSFLRAAFFPMFRPGRFWRSVSLHDRIEKKSLRVLIALSAMHFFIIFHGLSALYGTALSNYFNRRQFQWSYRTRWHVRSFSNILYELAGDYLEIGAMPFSAFRYWWPFPFMLIAGLASIFLVMANLRETIARFKLRPAHMLRVLAYATAPSLFLAAVVGSIMPFVMSMRDFGFTELLLRWFFILGSLWLCGVPMLLQLRAAFREYLRIPHATLAAFLLLSIGILAPIALFIAVSGFSGLMG